MTDNIKHVIYVYVYINIYLLERNESGRCGCSNSWPSVANWLVRDRVLGQIVSQHIWLNLYLIECLSIVYTDDATNHLWYDDHVSQVRADWLWLFTSSFHGFSSLAELLDEGHALSVQPSLESTALTGAVKLYKFVNAHIKELLQVDSTIRVLSEGSLPWLSVRHLYKSATGKKV